jgi:hypothetical protein
MIAGLMGFEIAGLKNSWVPTAPIFDMDSAVVIKRCKASFLCHTCYVIYAIHDFVYKKYFSYAFCVHFSLQKSSGALGIIRGEPKRPFLGERSKRLGAKCRRQAILAPL